VPATSGAAHAGANAQNSLQTAKAKGLNLLSGPDVGVALVDEYIQRMAKLPSYAKILGDPSQVQVEPTPIPYYVVNPRERDTIAGWESAQLHGFIYIIDAAGQPVTTVEIQTNDPSAVNAQNTQPTATDFGRSTQELRAALAYLATNDQIQDGSYDVRLVSGMVWLKSNTGGEDLVYFFSPLSVNSGAGGALQVNTLYSLNDYLKIIQQYQAQQTAKVPKTGG
jgi:hypothetical protein